MLHLLCLFLLLPLGSEDPAVAALIARLKTAPAEARVPLLKELEGHGPAGRAAVPLLMGWLKEPDRAKTHLAILRALERIGLDESYAKPLLADLMGRDQPAVAVAARLLGLVGEPALPFLLKAVDSSDPAARLRATHALFHYRALPPTVLPRLVPRLADDSRPVASAAAAVIGKMGPQAAPALPDLIKAIESKNVVAAHALGNIGPTGRAAVPTLRQALRDPETKEKTTGYKTDGESETRDVWLAEKAAEALGAIGADAAPAVPDLIQALGDRRAAVRLPSVRALGLIGLDAGTAVPALVQRIADGKEQRPIRLAAVRALSLIGEPSGPPLLEALESKDAEYRWYATLGLGQVRPVPKGGVLALGQRLTDPEPLIRATAAHSLGEIGAAAEQAVPHLAAALTQRGQHPEVQKESAVALGKVGEAAGKVLAYQTSKHGDPVVRQLAAQNLVKVRPLPREGLPALTAALSDRTVEVRLAAVIALGELGPEALPARPALEKSEKNDPSEEVRKAVREALDRVKE